MLSKLVSDNLKKWAQFKKKLIQLMEDIPFDDPLFPAAPGNWSIYSLTDYSWAGTVSGKGAVNAITPLSLRGLAKDLAAQYGLKIPDDLQVSYQIK